MSNYPPGAFPDQYESPGYYEALVNNDEEAIEEIEDWDEDDEMEDEYDEDEDFEEDELEEV